MIQPRSGLPKGLGMAPDLFVRPDGLPMAFIMKPTGVERQEIKRLVEAGGGVILSKPTLDYRDHHIKLLVRTEIPIKRDQDMFDYKYILDCVKNNELLSNLSDYKFKAHIPSIFEPYNPMDILLGNLKWSQIPKKQVGERVSDIEDDEIDEDMRRLCEADYRHHKANRLPYCKKEQQEIVNWIVKYSAYKLLKGNLVWQRMEEARVGRGRSWQSLKEHFRKTLIGQIHTFSLTRAVMDSFKVGMGLQEEVVTSGTECETREEVEARIKLVGIRPLRSRSKNRSSGKSVNRSESSSTSPSPSGQNRKPRPKGKLSKVPADRFDLTPNSSTNSDGLVPPPPRNRKSTKDREEGSPRVQEISSPGGLPIAVQENLSNKSPRYKNFTHTSKNSAQGLAATSKSSSYKTAASTSVTEECTLTMVDVGQDPELEQLLDQSVLPHHMREKFPSSESSEDIRTSPGRKRKLFSDKYMDESAEEDMFALTPVKKRSKNKARPEINRELPSTEEFLAGLREAASVELSRESSMDGMEGGVTSTQKVLDMTGEEDNVLQPVDVVSDDVFDADAELNLVISESGGSSKVPAGTSKSPSVTPTPSQQSLNLLVGSPTGSILATADPSTYTLSQAVMDLDQIPVIQTSDPDQDNVVSNQSDKVVDTQGLVDAFSSIGDDLPRLRPDSRQCLLTPVSTPPTRADIADVVNSSLPDEVTDNLPKDNQIHCEPQPSLKQVAKPLPTLRRSIVQAQPPERFPSTVNPKKNSDVNDDVFDFSDHEGALDEVDEAPAPAKSKGKKVRSNLRVPKSRPYWDSLKRRGENGGKSQGGGKREVEAHVGLTKGGEALLVVAGLPSDVDSEDIELVRTGREGRAGARNGGRRDEATTRDNSESTDDDQDGEKSDNIVRKLTDKTYSRRRNTVDNPQPGPSRERSVGEGNHGGGPKYKLKIVTVGKENSGISSKKAGRFQKEGDFFDKFRLPYSRREEEAIVGYFMEAGGFKLRRGNRVWKKMENCGTCQGRTWQSMKQRWEKYISKSLDKFGVTIEDLEEVVVQGGSEAGDEDDTDLSLDTSSMRGFRSNANYYTSSDDQKILEYITKNKRFSDLGGNALWQMMEQRAVLSGRSWGSLKERFRKVILKKIRTYGLSEENVRKFLEKNHENRLNTV